MGAKESCAFETFGKSDNSAIHCVPVDRQAVESLGNFLFLPRCPASRTECEHLCPTLLGKDKRTDPRWMSWLNVSMKC